MAGDLSVSGWVAQALEAATWAGAEIPDGMRQDLGRFLDAAWTGDAHFCYELGERSQRASIFPVGMLMGHILWEETAAPVLATWRDWLRSAATTYGRGPPLYTLYYGLRVSLLHEEGLTDPWRGWVGAVASQQVRKGGAAGMFPRKLDSWTANGGSVVITALAALTLEHALHER